MLQIQQDSRGLHNYQNHVSTKYYSGWNKTFGREDFPSSRL